MERQARAYFCSSSDCWGYGTGSYGLGFGGLIPGGGLSRKYSGPFWPQAATSAQAATSRRKRIKSACYRMDATEFEAAADDMLERIERALESLELDFERKEGGVLEVEFDDGSKIIVNRHSAAREIWVAARSGGFHFRGDGGTWRDTRGGEELLAALSRLVSEQLGRRILLR